MRREMENNPDKFRKVFAEVTEDVDELRVIEQQEQQIAEAAQESVMMPENEAVELAVKKAKHAARKAFYEGKRLGIKSERARKAELLRRASEKKKLRAYITKLAAQIAKTKYGVPRVLARLFDLDSRKPFAELGIRALSPAVSGAIDIRNYIEEVDFHRDSLLYSLEIDLVRLRIKAHLRGTSLAEVQKKANLRVIALIRDHEAILPVDDESLEEDDILVAAVHQDVVKDLRQYFRLEG
jgi:hypothetical protein